MTHDDLVAIEAIRRLFADYCHHYDDGDLDAWAQLFAVDGVMEVAGQRLEGRDAIHGWAEAAIEAAPQPSRHRIDNIAIDLGEDGSAVAVSDFVVVGADRTIAVVGRYHDALVVEEGAWRLAEHRLSFLRPAR